MENLTKELYSLVLDYLYYNYIFPKDNYIFELKNNIKELIVSNLGSLNQIIDLDKVISSIYDIKVKEYILEILKSIYFNSDRLSEDEKIYLYFEAQNFDFIGLQLKDKNPQKVIEYLNKSKINKEKIDKFIKIYGIRVFDYIELLNIPEGLLNFEQEIKTEGIDLYQILLKNYKKLTPNTISKIINKMSDLGYQKFKDILPYSDDSSLDLPFDDNINLNGKLPILQKLNEARFKKSLSEEDIISLKEMILSNANIPNGIKVNIIKLILSDKDIFGLTKEELLNLFNGVDKFSINLITLDSINFEVLDFLLKTNDITKFHFSSIDYIITSNISPLGLSKRLELFEHVISNDLISENIKLTPYFKNLLFNIGVTFEVFEKLILSGKFKNIKIKIIDSNYFSQEQAKLYLKNSTYYEALQNSDITKLLNLLSKEELLEVLNNKLFLLNLNTDIFRKLNNLEFEDIINSELICQTINRVYFRNMIEEYFYDTRNLTILLNKNVSQFLFGKGTVLNENDLHHINYLMDYVFNKEMNFDKFNIEIIDAFCAMYLILGINGSLDLINLSGINLNVADILKIKDNILQSKINNYRLENSEIINRLYDHVIFELNMTVSKENIYEYSDMGYSWLIEYAKVFEREKLEDLFSRYIQIKRNPESTAAEIKMIQAELRSFCEEIREKKIQYIASEFNKELIEEIKKHFKIKDSEIEAISEKLKKQEFISGLVGNTIRIMSEDTEEREYLINTLKSEIDLNGICDFEYFKNNMFLNILNKTFDKENFMEELGINVPENYEFYLQDLRRQKIVGKANRMFFENKEIFEYLLGRRENLSEEKSKMLVNINKIKYAFSEFLDYIDYDRGEIVYKSSLKYDEKECEDYYIFVRRINKISKNIFNVLKREILANEDVEITTEDIEEFCQRYPLKNSAYDVEKQRLSLEEIKTIFNNFDFVDMKISSKDRASKFLFSNIYNIKFIVAKEHDRFFVKDFGYILSHFDEVEALGDYFGIDIDDISVEGIKTLQDYIMLELNPLEKTYGKNVISEIISKSKLMISMQINQRLEAASSVYETALKRNSSTIPNLNCKEYEIVDYHDPQILAPRMNQDSCFAITGNGNNFSIYCILSKNGSIIYIKNPDTGGYIARLSAVRRGNAYFLHLLQIKEEFIDSEECKKYCEKVVEKLAGDIINATKNTEEPMEFVTLVDSGLTNMVKDKEYINGDSLEYATDPIDIKTQDYRDFFANKNLIYEVKENLSIYHNYSLGSYIIARVPNKTISDFKDYDASPIYIRERKPFQFVDFQSKENKEMHISNLQKLFYLEARKTNDEFESTRLAKSEIIENIKNLYLGEDFCVIIYNTNEVRVINLDYDERSNEEIKSILQEINSSRRNI